MKWYSVNVDPSRLHPQGHPPPRRLRGPHRPGARRCHLSFSSQAAVRAPSVRCASSSAFYRYRSGCEKKMMTMEPAAR